MRQRNRGCEVHSGNQDLRLLLQFAGFVRPYLARLVAALATLLVAAVAVLAVGQVFRHVVDKGLVSGPAASLDQDLYLFFGLLLTLAASVFLRSYLLNWLGERVVADLRQAVFGHVLGLDVGSSRSGARVKSSHA